jgi:hypothetical protein
MSFAYVAKCRYRWTHERTRGCSSKLGFDPELTGSYVWFFLISVSTEEQHQLKTPLTMAKATRWQFESILFVSHFQWLVNIAKH